MAVYVLLIKDYEDEERVVYKYGPNETVTGKIEYNKKTRNFKELEPIKDGSIPNEFFFKRAAQKLSIIVFRQNSNFPERTTVES